MKTLLMLAALLTATHSALAEKSVMVFVALCDNKTQGIVPVGKKIGDGDVPDENLYWGCTDGFGSYFKNSKRWKVVESTSNVSNEILRRVRLKHVTKDIVLEANAYRGSQIRKCTEDFEQAAASGKYDLVAYIGHDGLMDFNITDPAPVKENKTEVIVLCCVSNRYFGPRLKKLGCNPILLTQQLMYPGAFILHDALEVWSAGGAPAEIRAAAGRAYSRNQKISIPAATGVFAPPKVTK